MALGHHRDPRRQYLRRNNREASRVHKEEAGQALRLAQDHGLVRLLGGGFAASDWSVRIWFDNLEYHVYDDIGRATRAIARGYRETYEAATGKDGKAAEKKTAPAKR